MAGNQQNGDFKAIAGQLVASGINTNMPLVNFEEGNKTTNIANVGGLTSKIKDVFIRDTRVFGNPLDPYFTKFTQRWGAGMEQAMFGPASDQKVTPKSCMPWGSAPIASQINYCNFAYNIPITVRDHEVDAGVMDEDMLGSYIGAKLKTPLATLSKMKYRSEIQLLSNVIDGTRNITSNTFQNGEGVQADYAPSIQGYAGIVGTSDAVVPEVERGVKVKAPSIDEILTIAQELQGQAADFMIPGDDGNKKGIETFTTSKPLCIMETKVLNSFENAFINSNSANNASVFGYKFRDFIGTFSELVEIDSFASLPDNTSYTDVRLGAVLIDRDALIERVSWYDTESFRCTNERATGFSYQGVSTLSVAEMLPSYAMLFKTA